MNKDFLFQENNITSLNENSRNLTYQSTCPVTVYINHPLDIDVAVNAPLVKFIVKENIVATISIFNTATVNYQFHLAPNAQVKLHCIDIGTSFAINADLLEESAIDLNYYLVNQKKRHIHINVNHLQGKSRSQLSSYAVALGASSSIIDMCVSINKGALASASEQKSGILLIDDGQAVVKPIIKIAEAQAVANHGSYVGALEKELLFYLKSRRLNEKDAKALIVLGKMQALVTTFNEEFQQIINDKVKELIL